MSTPPVFLVAAVPAPGPAVLDGPEGRHAATVRRLRPGERLDLTDGAGTVAECVVRAAHRDRLELEVRRQRAVPRAEPRLVVVQALAKGERAELAVAAMTELGVDTIVPWQAERSVVRWQGERAAKGLARWRAAAREAAKQARRAYLPAVAEPHDTAAVAARLADAAAALVLHEGAAEPLTAVPLPSTGEVVCVVGPEGGISPAELTAFDRAGAAAVRLGPAVLRASTAGAATLAVLSARLGRWD